MNEIHIVPGPSARGVIREALGLTPESLLINEDLLSCGPLPPIDSLDRWQGVRNTYWKAVHRHDPAWSDLDSYRDWASDAERLRAAERITLWIGTGLAEQLLLIWTLNVLQRLDVAFDRFRFVQFAPNERVDPISIAVLDPAQFKQHPPPTTMDRAMVRQATAA